MSLREEAPTALLPEGALSPNNRKRMV
jgi:hypothetical protein